LKVYYTDSFVLPLPPGHRFPMSKYERLRERVSSAGWGGRVELRIPQAATDEQLLRAHDADYLRRVERGELTAREQRRIGFPWSPGMVERSRRSAGATIEACRVALEEGVAVSLAGGTHHAFRDQGEGFCVYNDSVVAALAMRAEGLDGTVAVIDTDVHQGNGTASICADDERLFTFSIHGATNFPYRKETSDLDVALPDGTGDEAYLAALARALDRVFDEARPVLAIHVSGADPWEGDRWGRLALTKRGLGRRDAMVLEACRARGIPVAVTMAGGYAPRVEDTVDIHLKTVETAFACRHGGSPAVSSGY
jgi:acetoin utilization deacetylase AcuC-like enzyme